MKRKFLIAAFVILPILVVLGIGTLLYFQFAIGQSAPPFTYQELQALHDNPDKAAKEVPRIIACFENGDEDVRLMAAETLKQVGKPAVEPLRSNLTHASAEVRFNCVQTLALLKNDAAPAVPELLVCAQDPNPRVRYKSIYALGQTGVKSEPVLKAMFDAFDDKDDRVPQTAQDMLDKLGAPAGDALPFLTKLAADGATPKVRQSAGMLIEKFGPLPFTVAELEKLQDNAESAGKEIPRFVATLIHGDENQRVLAAEALRPLGPKAVDPVRVKLSHPNADVRFWCLQTLAFLKKDAASAIPDLLICVSDPDARVRYKAIVALAQTGVTSGEVLQAYFKALEDADESVPETVLEVLAGLEKLPKESLPMVARAATKGKTQPIRHGSIKLLGKLGEPATPTFRTLLKDLPTEDYLIVMKAIQLLGADAKGLIPDLIPILTRNICGPENPNVELYAIFKNCDAAGARGLVEVLKATDGEQVAWNNRYWLLGAIGEMRSEAAANITVPVLVKLLPGGKSHETTRALEVLGDIGPAAHEAIPAVEEWTKSPIFGQQAREALVRIGKAPSPLTLAELEKLQEDPSRTATMIPRLMATFAKGDEDLRIFAAEALRQLGPKAIDAARAGLKNKNADIRFGCAQTLAFLKTEAAPAIPELLTCVRDKEPRVRYKAIYALGQTGVRSDEFFAAMIEALNDKDESVRDTVLEVFESMDTLPREVAPALAKRVGKDSSYEVRRKVLPILAKTGDHALPTFRELFKNAKHRNSDPATYPDYQILLHGVNQMKPAQLKSLLPELKTQLATIHGSSQTFEPDLVDMLKKCGPDGAKAMAESLLSVKKEFVVHQNRIDLLQAIGSMGKDADVAVPLLIDLLKANTPKSFAVEYRPQVAEALAEIGPGARDAIPAIQAMLKDPAVAEEARAALKRFGVKDKK